MGKNLTPASNITWPVVYPIGSELVLRNEGDIFILARVEMKWWRSLIWPDVKTVILCLSTQYKQLGQGEMHAFGLYKSKLTDLKPMKILAGRGYWNYPYIKLIFMAILKNRVSPASSPYSCQKIHCMCSLIQSKVINWASLFCLSVYIC